ncbi:MAG: SIMPL domain-containing protein [Bacteriovoracaceae bacterium]|nr:SIMPL domain-containing protein [Bacteriovoracaceae bacterium]
MIFLLLSLLSSAHASRVISVQGRCEIKVVPDRGTVQIKTEKTAKDPADAVNEVTKKIEAAKARIQKMGLKDLELRTTHFQVFEQREWENNKNVFKGHRASFGLEVTTSDIQKLGHVMADAAQLGLTGTEGFRTFLSLEKSQSEYLKCLDIASQDAIKKAKQLGKSLNAEVGEVESISESPMTVSGPQPIYAQAMDSMRSMEKSVATPSIEAGEQTFATTLHVNFKLR